MEIGSEEASVDLFVVVEYGTPIQTAASGVQENVRKAIETMTGLHVVEVNVFVQGVTFEPSEQESAKAARRKEKAKEKEVQEVEAEIVPPEPPRVK